MPTPTALALFAVAAALIILTPGPNWLYILTRGMADGRRAALISAAGLGCGVAVHTSFAALGLSALLRSSTALFHTVKYAGAIYLIFLGIKTWRASHRPPTSAPAMRGGNALALIRQSMTVSLLNPKTALFFLTFLPQFVDVERGSVALQIVQLGAIHLLLTLCVYGTVAYFSGGVGDRLQRSPRFATRFRRLSGSMLIGLGLWAGLPERR